MHFVQDVFLDGAVVFIRLAPENVRRLIQVTEQFDLDFDDAQYAAAEKYKLSIVSFDGDFDRTERGRVSPAEVRRA
ncbi:MAG: hypothetical protein HY724_07510 [Candidatus Rokubacteria bacterium]|nr:hypothetical protein [Candidatus Rokubacteria bacterium]